MCQTVCFLLGLVMFFKGTNLDTKLHCAILGQDCNSCDFVFSISHPFLFLFTHPVYKKGSILQ